MYRFQNRRTKWKKQVFTFYYLKKWEEWWERDQVTARLKLAHRAGLLPPPYHLPPGLNFPPVPVPSILHNVHIPLPSHHFLWGTTKLPRCCLLEINSSTKLGLHRQWWSPANKKINLFQPSDENPIIEPGPASLRETVPMPFCSLCLLSPIWTNKF